MTDLERYLERPVWTVQPSATLVEASRLLCKHGVGALVITDPSDARPLGVVTDRDLVWLLSEGVDPAATTIDQFVRRPLVKAAVSDDLREAAARMREAGVRRLPVVDAEGELLGVLSMDDLIVSLGRELGDLAAAVASELDREGHIGAAKGPRLTSSVQEEAR